MLKWITKRVARKFESQIGVDLPYAQEMADLAPSVHWKMMLMRPAMGHRRVVPPADWHLAQLAAVQAEDCGPCVQIAVNFSLMDKVDPALLEAALAGGEQLSGDAKLAYDYGRAVATSAPDMLELIDRAQARWGREGLMELALAVAYAGVYPRLKRGWGYAVSCSKIDIAVARPKALAA